MQSSDVNKVLAEARSWLETPFQHQGRTKGLAVDCIGIVTCINKELGWGTYDRTDYGRAPFRHELEQGLQRLFGSPIGGAWGTHEFRNPELPNIILFEWAKAGRQHVGIKTSRGIIHAYQTGLIRRKKRGHDWRRGCVVETDLSTKDIRRIKAVFQWRV